MIGVKHFHQKKQIQIAEKESQTPSASTHTHSPTHMHQYSCCARCLATKPIRQKTPPHPRFSSYIFSGCYYFVSTVFTISAHMWRTYSDGNHQIERQLLTEKSNAIHFETHWKRKFAKLSHILLILRTARRTIIGSHVSSMMKIKKCIARHHMRVCECVCAVCTVVAVVVLFYAFTVHIWTQAILRLVLFWKLFVFYHFHTRKK